MRRPMIFLHALILLLQGKSFALQALACKWLRLTEGFSKIEPQT
jgi:hypothetical protein